MSELLTLLVLSMVTYRATRFVILDTLIDEWRDMFHGWLLNGKKTVPLWREKLHELLACVFCLSIWVGLALVFTLDRNVGLLAIIDKGISIPLPGLYWMALSTGSLVFSRYIDTED